MNDGYEFKILWSGVITEYIEKDPKIIAMTLVDGLDTIARLICGC